MCSRLVKNIGVRFLTIAFASLALYSCSKKLELPDINTQKKITLLAELVADDSIYLRVGQSVPLTKNSPLYFQLLQNSTVTIQQANQQAITATPVFELFEGQAYTVPYTSPQKILHSTTYTVNVNNAELGSVNAVINIPTPFAATVVDTAIVQHLSADALQVDISITDAMAEENFYIIEVLKQLVTVKRLFLFNNNWLDMEVFANKITYDSLITSGIAVQKKSDTIYKRVFTRQGVYTNDLQTENVKDGDLYAKNKRVLLRDVSFNGQTYTTRIIVSNEVSPFAEEAQKGVTHVLVKSVPKAYFEFLKAYEQYDPSIGFNSMTPPIKLTGNVNNGLGMVGAAYQHKFSYWFDRWDF